MSRLRIRDLQRRMREPIPMRAVSEPGSGPSGSVEDFCTWPDPAVSRLYPAGVCYLGRSRRADQLLAATLLVIQLGGRLN